MMLHTKTKTEAEQDRCNTKAGLEHVTGMKANMSENRPDGYGGNGSVRAKIAIERGREASRRIRKG